MKQEKKEDINKERRYILIGMFSIFTVVKGLSILSPKKVKQKNLGTLVIANALWKIMSLIRFILKI